MTITVRSERVADVAAIAEVVRAAFLDHPHSDGSEPAVVERLRDWGELMVSLVAAHDGQVIGHAAFSAITLTPPAPGWFGLGPLAVHPRWQRQGIGAPLVWRGLEQLRAMAAAGGVVFGDPGYYGRFGFRSWPQLRYPAGPAALFQALTFGAAVPDATVAYSKTFG